MANNAMKINTIIKNRITDFCKDKLNKIFIKKLINFLQKRSIIIAPARI